ncbi:MAG: ferrous iron transport protein B [Candidatus Bathyarchaeia archaeon]
MPKDKLIVALAGNANVGKSVIFNQLTGLHQHIGNWPGKTVERAEGTLYFKGYTIDVIDLPGIYSLSTYSMEELVSREYIAVERPDVVVNVVDASVLERNLFFTLQLMELETPMVVALNQMDIAKKKGIDINVEKLEKLLGVPVVPTIGIKGVGISQLLDKVIEVSERGQVGRKEIKYGKEIEERIDKLTKLIESIQLHYPPRYLAIKLLEGDEEIEREIGKLNPQIVSLAKRLAKEIEKVHGHSCSSVITSERYERASHIMREVQKIIPPLKPSFEEKLHSLTTHKILGYPVMISVLLLMFYSVFIFGGLLSEFLNPLLYGLEPVFSGLMGAGAASSLIWSVMEGVIAGVTVVLPYIVPFYIILYILEDSGYLSRVAFLMDSIMHKMGLHGKAFIPLMLGYGCNVPACLGCRIMETERERLLAVFVTTLVPCAARTVIILGLVGRFLGIHWSLMLYILNLAVIFAVGRLAFKTVPGEPTALIMEMSVYRVPHLKTVLKQTWFRVLEFIKIAFPLIIVGSFFLKMLEVSGILAPIADLLSPITVGWLGLPAVTGVTLIFGVLRKELTLIMLSALIGTTDFAMVLTPTQMVVFTVVTIFYVPCISTIAALIKEVRLKRAILITLFEVAFALILGGATSKILELISV